MVVLERVGIRGRGTNSGGPASDADCAADSSLSYGRVGEARSEFDIGESRALGVWRGCASRKTYRRDEDEPRCEKGRAFRNPSAKRGLPEAFLTRVLI